MDLFFIRQIEVFRDRLRSISYLTITLLMLCLFYLTEIGLFFPTQIGQLNPTHNGLFHQTRLLDQKNNPDPLPFCFAKVISQLCNLQNAEYTKIQFHLDSIQKLTNYAYQSGMKNR